MSLSVAIISINKGWIFSDSRITGSVYIKNGKPTEEPSITDENNKTFSCPKNNLIGACIGFMAINGRETIEIVKEYLNGDKIISIKETLNKLHNELIKDALIKDTSIKRLKTIEISVIWKNIEVVEMGVLEIRPVDTPQEFKSNVDSFLPPNEGYFSRTYGDTKAQEYFNNNFKKVIFNTTPSKFVENKIRPIIRQSINASSTHIYGKQKTCGGKINVQRI